MNMGLANGVTFFGKIPARGDFVKGSGQHQLISVLDRWVSQAMESLSIDPRWKEAYDGAAPIDFVFSAAMSRLAVVGHLRPSLDCSGRRFPFVIAASVARDDVLMFRCGPAGLGTVYANFAGLAELAMSEGDVAGLLAKLDQNDPPAEFETALQSDPLGTFVRRTTIDALAEMIGAPSPDTVRRIILAIGLLMRPALGQGTVSIDKEIVLPLPVDEDNRNLAAALWVYLISAFVRKTTVEFQVLIARDRQRPRLVVGFNGTAATTLLVALASDLAADRVIALNDPEWVEEQPDLFNDYGVAKLSTYLSQSGQTL